MRRLSTWVRPRIASRCAAALVALALLAMLWFLTRGTASRSPMYGLSMLIVGLGAMFTRTGLLPLVPRDTLDGAWLDGDEVLLRRGHTSARLPLVDLAAVEYDRHRNLVTLVPRVPCILGDWPRFRPRRHDASGICRELRARLHEVAADAA